MPLICTKNSFIMAARRGDTEALEKHFNSWGYKDEWLNARDKNGVTPLYYAAKEGHAAVVQKLIAKGADINLAPKGGYSSPIGIAVRHERTEVVKILLNAKALTDVIQHDGYPPLVIAAWNGKKAGLEMMKHLITAGADIRGFNNFALCHSAQEGKIDSVKMLLEAGANINQPNNGSTPLHYAIYKNHNDVIEYLIQQGAKTDIPNKEGKTALDLAGENPSRISGALKVQVDKSTESWVRMGADKIAYVGIYPELQKKLTDIFNFTTRERILISENVALKIENTLPPESFDALGDDALRIAFDNFKNQGGKADEAFVFKHRMLEKTSRQQRAL